MSTQYNLCKKITKKQCDEIKRLVKEQVMFDLLDYVSKEYSNNTFDIGYTSDGKFKWNGECIYAVFCNEPVNVALKKKYKEGYYVEDEYSHKYTYDEFMNLLNDYEQIFP